MKALLVLSKLNEGYVVQVGSRKLRMVDGQIYTRGKVFENGKPTNRSVTMKVHTSINSFIEECETLEVKVGKKIGNK